MNVRPARSSAPVLTVLETGAALNGCLGQRKKWPILAPSNIATSAFTFLNKSTQIFLQLTEARVILETLSLSQLFAVLSKTCVVEGSFRCSGEEARRRHGIILTRLFPPRPSSPDVGDAAIRGLGRGSILVGAYTFQDSQPANEDKAPVCLQRMNFRS